MPILTKLVIYPIKSCGGIALQEALITESGLSNEGVHDREWMVVDAEGRFITQRSFPKMALIKPLIKADMLELSMSGMPPLEIPIAMPSRDTAHTIDVQVWNDCVNAYDCGEGCAQWFSQAMETPCRLVRFHEDAKRIANPKWTAGIEASNLFSDGYPILIISEASLEDLNQKLRQQDRAALPMDRFRPNIVIAGVDAFEEDYAAGIRIGQTLLRPVKPCPRCPIPSIDQETGLIGPDPLDILRTYRVNPKVNGGITFGMNAVVEGGAGVRLRVGQNVEVTLDF